MKCGANTHPLFHNRSSAQRGWSYTPNFTVHACNFDTNMHAASCVDYQQLDTGQEERAGNFCFNFETKTMATSSRQCFYLLTFPCCPSLAKNGGCVQTHDSKTGCVSENLNLKLLQTMAQEEWSTSIGTLPVRVLYMYGCHAVRLA